jgi:hypothetical protein
MALLPGQTTRGDVKLLAQQLADKVGSPFVSDAEWNTYIQLGLNALYDLLIQKYGNDYFVAPAYALTADGVSDTFSLPDGSTFPAFYKLLGVDVQVSGAWLSLSPFMMSQRNRYPANGTAGDLRYRLAGSKLWLTPRAAAGLALQVWYIPRLTPLTTDADVIDGVSGWEELVAVKAAIKALQKEESDASILTAEEAKLTHRIVEAAENRDAGAPMTVGDTLFRDYCPW